MTRPRLLLAIATGAACLLAGCERRAPHDASTERTAQGADTAAAQRAVRDLVARFGSRLQMVSLLAPDSIVTAQLRDAYGALVTPKLLADWTAHPDRAPGRRVSSPWPDSIRVASVRALGGGEFEVTGTVLYVTSVERARGEGEGEGEGEGGSATSKPVSLRVGEGADGTWRISAYAEGA